MYPYDPFFRIGPIIFLVIIGFYIYVSFAIMAIAKKTKTENPWLAWIPIANVYLIIKIAKLEWWYLLVILGVSLIPIVGWLIQMGLIVWIWSIICARLKRSRWLSLLMVIPIVNFILLGVLAWSD